MSTPLSSRIEIIDAETPMLAKKVRTTHAEIGFTPNVALVRTALAEVFGFESSTTLQAVAENVWSSICSKMSPIEWGLDEINVALALIQRRITEYRGQVADRLEGKIPSAGKIIRCGLCGRVECDCSDLDVCADIGAK